MSYFNLGSAYVHSKDAKEGQDYIVIKDGNQAEFKVLNIDNEHWMGKSGIIEFTPLVKSKRHINNVNIRQYRDVETGFIVGIPTGIDNRTKQIIWQPVEVKDVTAFDLSIPQERARAIVFSRSIYVVGSPNFRHGSKTKYKVVDKEKDAQTFIKTRIVKRKAADIADALTGAALRDVAYALGKDPKLMSEIMLMQEVIQFAEENPAKFVEIYESEGRIQLTILKRGLACGILQENIDRGITYGGVSLGYNEYEAIEHLKKNAQIQTSIDMQSRKKEEESLGAMASVHKQETVQIKDEKDAKIALLEIELAKAKREQEKATEAALNVKAESDIADLNPELAELRKEAEVLKIKGWKLYKDPVKLAKAIKEYKATLVA